MTDKFIAIAPKGKEFVYKRSSMIAVPDHEDAGKICQLLNEQKFEIKEGETWYEYDNDWFKSDYITREVTSVVSGKVVVIRKYAS